MIEQKENDSLRKQLAQDLAFSLERNTPPALLTEQELQRAGVQSEAKSQFDRANGTGLPYLKVGGRIKYSLNSVLDLLIASKRFHTGDIDRTPAQRAATKRNLQQAQRKKCPAGVGAGA